MANQNVTQLTQQTGSADTSSLFYAVTGGSTDTGLPLSVFVNNLGLTGAPTAPTASTATSTTQIASTAFVHNVTGSYALLTGASFSGQLQVSYAGPTLTINDTSGSNNATIRLQANSSTVWAFHTASTGGGFSLDRYNAGSLVDSPLTITSAGAVAWTTRPTFAGNTPWDSANLNLASPPAIGATTPGAVSSSSGALNGSLGATTASTVKATTIAATGLISPTSTIGILGTATNDNAQAGSIGEVITSTVATGSAVALTNNTAATVTSISLTAGDWDIQGIVNFNVGSTTSTIQVIGSISTSAATQAIGFQGITNISPSGVVGWLSLSALAPYRRIQLASTTTIYLIGFANFTVSTIAAWGTISARRAR